MMHDRMCRFAVISSVALVTLVAPSSLVRAQVAPIQYWIPGGPFGIGGSSETQFWGAAPDEDGFRKGFSFRSFSAPVNATASSLAFSGLGGFASSGLGGLAVDGAQYAYSFKGPGDVPVSLFGGVTALRSTSDVFTSIVTPGFERSSALASSVNAGIEFKPTANTSLSFSANIVQPSQTQDTDLRSQLLSGYRR